jgi:hypothetical protein
VTTPLSIQDKPKTSTWQRTFWWERDPTEPNSESEEPDTPEEEFHTAPELAPTEPCLIPTDIEDSLSSNSTSSDEFPDERPPRQLLAHPSLRMSTHDTKLRAGAPIAFNGSIKKASQWLHSVKAYFAVNTTVYNTDEKKVITALTYMTEGMAAAWSDTFYQLCKGRTTKYGTWVDFKKEFRDMFIPADASIVALNKIQKLKQQKSLTSYVAEFCALEAVANIKESHVLIHMFNLGLNNNLLCTIHMMGEIPTDFDKYVTAVMKIESNINRGNTTISLTNTNHYRNYCPQFKPQRKDDNAMDVDRLDEDVHVECMAKGLCFLCCKHGHWANHCPDKKKKIPVRQERIEEE